MHTLLFTENDYASQTSKRQTYHHDGLTRELAIKRMEDQERWVQEHREELEVSSQQLFDDMFGG